MRKVDKLQWLTEEIARSKDFLSEIDSKINNYKDEIRLITFCND